MSIRPVDFQGMMQRTQDVSTIKQNEDNQPVVQQQAVYTQETKKIDQRLHQVNDAEEKENGGYQYDAKEKGNGQYEETGGRSSDRKKQSERGRDRVIVKGAPGGFDMKI